MPPVRLDPFRQIVGVGWSTGVMLVQSQWFTPNNDTTHPPQNMITLKVEPDDPTKTTIEDMGHGNPPFLDMGDGNSYTYNDGDRRPIDPRVIVTADYGRMWLTHGVLRAKMTFQYPNTLDRFNPGVVKSFGWRFSIAVTSYSLIEFAKAVKSKQLTPSNTSGGFWYATYTVTTSELALDADPPNKQTRVLTNADSPILLTSNRSNSPVLKEIFGIKDP